MSVFIEVEKGYMTLKSLLSDSSTPRRCHDEKQEKIIRTKEEILKKVWKCMVEIHRFVKHFSQILRVIPIDYIHH